MSSSSPPASNSFRPPSQDTSRRRVALVTGGAKRVGRAIVTRLAEAGLNVGFTYHSSQAAAEEMVELLSRGGRDVLAINADLQHPEAAGDSIGAAIQQRFGRLDVLVNNASTYRPARLRDTDAAMMRIMDAVHVYSPLILAKRFESMLRANRGHIINMVDLLADRPLPEYLAYCASKAALSNLTLGLARELAPEVTVNAIAPGVVAWPDGYPADERERYLKRVPLGRAGTPDDVANLVHFLIGEGSYITGQIIRLDGGRSIT